MIKKYFLLLILVIISNPAYSIYKDGISADIACLEKLPPPSPPPVPEHPDPNYVYGPRCDHKVASESEEYGFDVETQGAKVCRYSDGHAQGPGHTTICGVFIFWLHGCPPGHALCPCKFPYSLDPIAKQCVKDCPPYKPELNEDIGQCMPIKNKKPPRKQCAGNPVDISTGEKTQTEEPDYQSYGPLPLYFQRNYQSYRADESNIFWQRESSGIALDMSKIDIAYWTRYIQPEDYEPPFTIIRPSPWVEDRPPVAGHKQWRHNYQSKLINTESQLIIDSLQGYNSFKLDGENYISTALSQETIKPVQLENGSSGWHYFLSPRYSEYYNSQGQLVRIEQSASIYQTLTYNAEGQLITVTHSLGGSLQLAYNEEGQLSQLITPNNKTIDYSYDSRGNPIQVNTTFTNGETRSRTYHYENSHLPYALTGITDKKGIRFASWTYNYQGKVIESVHAGGTDKTTFIYNGANTTSVTNALNKTTIYRYRTGSGIKRLAIVEGVATENCLAANKEYRYDDNGLVTYKSNWQEHPTIYQYNDKHQEISRTEVVDTSQRRTITTQWHETFNLPVQVTEPTRIITYSYDSEGRLLSKTIIPNNGQGE